MLKQAKVKIVTAIGELDVYASYVKDPLIIFPLDIDCKAPLPQRFLH
jgi:hypothetical protein